MRNIIIISIVCLFLSCRYEKKEQDFVATIIDHHTKEVIEQIILKHNNTFLINDKIHGTWKYDANNNLIIKSFNKIIFNKIIVYTVKWELIYSSNKYKRNGNFLSVKKYSHEFMQNAYKIKRTSNANKLSIKGNKNDLTKIIYKYNFLGYNLIYYSKLYTKDKIINKVSDIINNSPNTNSIPQGILMRKTVKTGKRILVSPESEFFALAVREGYSQNDNSFTETTYNYILPMILSGHILHYKFWQVKTTNYAKTWTIIDYDAPDMTDEIIIPLHKVKLGMKIIQMNSKFTQYSNSGVRDVNRQGVINF